MKENKYIDNQFMSIFIKEFNKSQKKVIKRILFFNLISLMILAISLLSRFISIYTSFEISINVVRFIALLFCILFFFSVGSIIGLVFFKTNLLSAINSAIPFKETYHKINRAFTDQPFWYTYFQTEMINQLYESLFGPVPKEIIKKQYEKGSDTFTSRFQSDLNLLKKIGIEISDEQKELLESGYSSELKWSIPSLIKYRELRAVLHDRGKVTHLNDFLSEDIGKEKGISPFFTFEAKILFGFEVDFERTNSDELVVIRKFKKYEDFYAKNVEFIPLVGLVDGYYFFYYCSKRYFFEISRSEVFNLLINSELSKEWLPSICRGFAIFKGLFENQNRIDIKPLAFSLSSDSLYNRPFNHPDIKKYYKKIFKIGKSELDKDLEVGKNNIIRFQEIVKNIDLFSNGDNINKFPELDEEDK